MSLYVRSTHNTQENALCGNQPHRAFSGKAEFIATISRNDARINVRLPSELKQTIEEAASTLGQTVSEFAISTVVREARQVLQNAQITHLSNRDRDRFLPINIIRKLQLPPL